MTKELTAENIDAVLDRIRPNLRVDGGDVEIASIEGDYIKVRLLGECHSCPLNLMTLKAAIERLIMLEFPQVKRVDSVN